MNRVFQSARAAGSAVHPCRRGAKAANPGVAGNARGRDSRARCERQNQAGNLQHKQTLTRSLSVWLIGL
jgi:hypothetical protein